MNLMNATDIFLKRKNELEEEYKSLVEKPNMPIKEFNNGIFTRYQNPVLTNQHIPLEWKFDFNPESNPYFLEKELYISSDINNSLSTKPFCDNFTISLAL